MNNEAYENLRQRIEAKKNELSQKEQVVKLHLNEVKEELTPGKLIKGAMKNIIGEVSGGPNNLIKTGIGFGAGLLADRFLFRSGGFLVKSAGRFVVQKLIGSFVSKRETANG